jgi:hypothetical protein
MENENEKQRYIELCENENSIPIFSQHWWLDAVAGPDNWNVALIEENGEILASLPYYVKKMFGFKVITMPPLTPKMGVWIRYPSNQDHTSKISYEKKLIDDLIEQLPSNDMFIQNFDPTFVNWLPFYWKGFAQTTKYTYILHNIKDHQTLYRNFRSNVKRNIKKAQKCVKVTTDHDLSQFYEVYKKTFERQNLDVPHTLELLSRIDAACSKNGCRKIFFAEDDSHRIHAAIYMIWDHDSAYYIMGGADPNLRNSGAMSLLFWEAIQYTSTFVQKFDFEGSMIEPIERFVRTFGGVQTPYFQIRKTNSLLLSVRKAFKDALEK